MSAEQNGHGRAENGTFTVGNKAAQGRGQNKVSTKVKESIVNFLEANIDKIQADFDTLKPRERLQFIAEIIPYAAPKLSSTQIDGKIDAGISIRFADPGDYVYPTSDQGSTGIPESL